MSGAALHSPLDASLPATHQAFRDELPPGADELVHMLAGVVDHVIERCTLPGDTVFDPFAGFGTTLQRAVALGRRSAGIELLPERVEYLRRRIPSAQVAEGDARELLRILRRAMPKHSGSRSAAPTNGAPQLPMAGFDLVLTSPPYMTAEDHDPDPLTAYVQDGGDYGRYLSELGLVAAQCARVTKPGGYVVWNVADIQDRGTTTRLIRDCSRVLSQHLEPAGVTRIEWDRFPHDLVADALLVYRRRT